MNNFCVISRLDDTSLLCFLQNKHSIEQKPFTNLLTDIIMDLYNGIIPQIVKTTGSFDKWNKNMDN